MTPATTGAADDRRRRILAATVDVVRRRGFAGARVSDIAVEAGTSPGLVLYHFGSLAGALTEALTWLEDAFYVDLDATLDDATDPVTRLCIMADLGAGSGLAVGEWVLWLELWVRALRDERAHEARETLDRRWRSALHDVIKAGVKDGTFAPRDAWDSAVRLACLMDGLAIQLALRDAQLDPARFRALWLESAALELGVSPDVFRRAAAAVADPAPCLRRGTARLRRPTPAPRRRSTRSGRAAPYRRPAAVTTG